MYFTAGLIFIILAWIIQFYKSVIQKDTSINPYFLLLYVVGVIFLVAGNLFVNDLTSCILNFVSAILPLSIFVAMIRK